MTTLGKLLMAEIVVTILIFAILIYFLSKWILKRLKLGNEKNRKIISSIIAIIFSPTTYVGLIVIWSSIANYYPKEEFSKVKWDNNIEERYVMSKDIIKNKILIGKTKDEVIELLGNEFQKYDENHIAYSLGTVPGFFNLDPDVLDIFFGDARVIKVSQHNT